METNYYAYFKLTEVEQTVFEKFNLEIPRLHIGKLSTGWKFLFQAYKEGQLFNCPSLESSFEWLCFLNNRKDEIRIVNDEDSQENPCIDLVTLMGNAQNLKSHEVIMSSVFVDSFGYELTYHNFE